MPTRRSSIPRSWRHSVLAASLVSLLALSARQDPKQLAPSQDQKNSYGVTFVDIARAAGLTHQTVYGDQHKNRYLLETTGCGVAWFDYDNDGWLDLFFVNGTRLKGISRSQEPTTHLYRNNRDGTFTDVTKQAGL